mmetsp:Transcript_64738/g.183722  ORF Transcript_64738/g.183722 Transcript_64738/m.183722 type:complete len:207 (+) Transcript_64738:252-872(+)
MGRVGHNGCAAGQRATRRLCGRGLHDWDTGAQDSGDGSGYQDVVFPLPLLGGAVEDVPADARIRGQHSGPDSIAVHPAIGGALPHGGLVAHPPATVVRDVEEEVLVHLVLKHGGPAAIGCSLHEIVHAIALRPRDTADLDDGGLLGLLPRCQPLLGHGRLQRDADHGVRVPGVAGALQPPVHVLGQSPRLHDATLHVAARLALVLA